ncbi:MAG: ABC transporter permease subunit, partial [Acidimicrobiia bacterium]
MAIAAAMVAGVVLGAPTLRLRGDYLAIVTLGFGEIVRIVANNIDVTNGPRGVSSIPHPPPGPPGIDLGPLHVQFSLAPLPYIYLVILASFGAVALLTALQRSRVGRAWIAIREDEDAAEVMGVPTYAMKLWSFAIGASTGGLAGALYASKAGYISPVNFELLVSILILAAVVLGGMGSTAGVILGASAIAFLPEYFREFQRYRVLVFGAALVVLMVVRPQGLLPSRRRAVELVPSLPKDGGGAVLESSLPGNRPERVDVDLDLREALAEHPRTTAPDASAPVLRLERLGVTFGGVRALQGLDLEVRPGEIVSLIGPNGAGKTTVFNCVTGMARPSGGQILFEGRSLTGRRPHRITRQGVARTFQNIRLFSNMTALENVLVGSDARHHTSVPGALARSRRHRREEADGRAIALALLDFVGIGARSSDVASNLSYGDQRRLEIARALATRPRLLLLDEPAAGMNPAEKRALVGLIRRIQGLGLTLLLIEHDMGLV